MVSRPRGFGSAPALAALDQLPDLLAALLPDLLVEGVAPLVPDGDPALPAGLRDRHAAARLFGLRALCAGPLAIIRHVLPPVRAPPRALRLPTATALVGRPPASVLACAALLDQLPHLVAALAPDLLVEGRTPLGLDGLAALLADLLVEPGAALGLDGLAALLADLLVELPAPGLADADAPLATGLRDRHRPLAATLLLFSHGSPPCSPGAQCDRCADAGAGPDRARARR